MTSPLTRVRVSCIVISIPVTRSPGSTPRMRTRAGAGGASTGYSPMLSETKWRGVTT